MSSLRTVLFLVFWSVASGLRDQPRRIAVVGAGIGGSSAAFFLRQEFGPVVQIDVFESGAVGGRLATVKIDDQEYETGGSVLHPLNLHMKHFIDRLGLNQRESVPSKMAIFDGKELSFEESDWFIVNMLRLLWRYGFNFLRMQMWVEGILDKIYQYQQFGYSFSTVEKLLHAMGGDSFLALANQTLEEAMLGEGFSQVFLNDIVVPITRVNYGQSVRINAFVGAVSLAGADPGLWAVEGGNKLVCSGLLYHSKARLITARVSSVTLRGRPTKSGATSVYEVNSVGESGPAHSLYDIVVVATPLHHGKSDISFLGLTPPVPSHFPGRYHRTVSTLVRGLLNVSYLGDQREPLEFRVSEVLTSEGCDLHSLSSIDPVTIPTGYRRPAANQPKVWKIFSPRQLSEEQLDAVFLSREPMAPGQETDWLAYPEYRPPLRKTPPFVLHHGLYYLNAVEWAASAMEMSAIAARNTALLAHHRWHHMDQKIDQEDLHIPKAKMRSVVPLLLFLALVGVRTALSASLESQEKEKAVVEDVAEMTELQKTDQIEFEAAQKNEKHIEESHYLEAAHVETETVHVETVVELVSAGNDSTEAAHVETETVHVETVVELVSAGDDSTESADSPSQESASESTEDTDNLRQRREHHETATEKISSFGGRTTVAAKVEGGRTTVAAKVE
ncbi:hypothetical protein NHX12_028117, partial [Muraenolepis orangiensis]